MNKFKVALLQQGFTQEKSHNLDLCLDQIAAAAAQGADLVILPELHLNHYFCQTEATENFDLAEPLSGPSSIALAAAAKDHRLVLVCSLFERRAAGLYHNTAVVYDRDGSLAGSYRKMHIPDDPGFYEKFYFTPGDGDFRPIQTSIGNLGLLICWDQWYPEAARLMALAGADLLLYPTAIGWAPNDDRTEQQRQLDAWRTVQRGHAIANGLPLITVNRTGFEPDPSGASAGIDFWGHSFAVGPQGEWLTRTEQKPDLLLTEIDLSRSEEVRRIWPFLRDRRIDAYEDLGKRYRDEGNN